MNHVWLAIIAGGQGTRLFPYSHPERPKQFCRLNNKDYFVQAVIENFAGLGVKRNQIVVITTNPTQTKLAQALAMPRGVLSQNIYEISESAGYTNAMVLASEFIHRLDPEAVVINTPSDQYIVADDGFRQAIEDAVTTAQSGSPVIVGVKISDLLTAMGCGHAIYHPIDVGPCADYSSFIEKPNHDLADAIMRADNSVCNTGINVWRTTTVLEPQPLIMPSGQGTAEFMACLELRANSHDGLKVAIGNFEWRDCGTLNSLYKISDKTPNHRNASLGDVDRFECLDSLFLCDQGYRLHAAGCTEVAVVVTTIENRLAVAVINRTESARVKKLAEDFARNRDLLVNDFTIMAHNNLVMRSNISNEAIACFVCVDSYAVCAYRASDGMIDVFVSKQRAT